MNSDVLAKKSEIRSEESSIRFKKKAETGNDWEEEEELEFIEWGDSPDIDW